MSQNISQSLENQLTIIDSSLTPDNAFEKGYRYVEDIPNLYKALLELLECAEKQGYKLGNTDGKDEERYFGLYCKMHSSNNTLPVKEEI